MGKVVVLNDGQTYSAIGGCRILTIPSGVIEEDDVAAWVKRNCHSGTSIQTGAVDASNRTAQAIESLTCEVQGLRKQLRIP